jgi:hypothetical protein
VWFTGPLSNRTSTHATLVLHLIGSMLLLGRTTPSFPQEVGYLHPPTPPPLILSAPPTPQFDMHFPHQHAIWSLEHLQQCSVYDPAKFFFTSKFGYVLFCNFINKIETGTANRVGGRTTNSKPPGLIIMIGQSETLSSS